MSGHSKWASIKHKKGALDAKRGKLFSKIIKELSVAARLGGGDPDGNPRLRTVVAKAKEANMPADNIKRAIQKGTGELPGVVLEEFIYEGYGPAGVAMLVEAMTDNRNRTTARVRSLFSKGGGSLGEAGCVAWMFSKKGFITVNKEDIAEEKIFDLAIEAGAEDVKTEETSYEITTEPGDFESVITALKKRGVTPAYAEVTMVPQSYVSLAESEARQVLRLVENLEDDEDVQQVYANFDIPEEIMAEISD
ncbi:MAG: YebC/PmpR family DNA-binding transcriptional regulator [bacterium]|nr:YebC/PmpR family DNA-binding transcriptional regulator [bacterium]